MLTLSPPLYSKQFINKPARIQNNATNAAMPTKIFKTKITDDIINAIIIHTSLY